MSIANNKVKYVEIFKSIQGEGFNYGKEVIFIRFNDCNLNCPWCDTNWQEFEYEFTNSELLEHIKQWDCKNVILTGGEPTKNYEAFLSVVNCLKDNGYKIHIETNGLNQIDIDGIWISTSPKIIYSMLYRKKGLIKHADEVRVVIDPNVSIDKQIEALEWFKNNIEAKYYYLSPCEVEGKFELEKLAQIYDKVRGQWMISLQLHKLQNIR